MAVTDHLALFFISWGWLRTVVAGFGPLGPSYLSLSRQYASHHVHLHVGHHDGHLVHLHAGHLVNLHIYHHVGHLVGHLVNLRVHHHVIKLVGLSLNVHH